MTEKYLGRILGFLLLVTAFFSLQHNDFRWWSLFWTAEQRFQMLLDRQQYQEAIRVAPDAMRRGTAYYIAGDFKSAAAAFPTESAEGLFNRGNSLLMLGLYEKAIESYGQSLSLRPHWREAQENQRLSQARLDRKTPPEDDSGGTGGKLAADDYVFGERGQNGSPQTVDEEDGQNDAGMRALWLQKVQTRPADFLRVKFRAQLAEGEKP